MSVLAHLGPVDVVVGLLIAAAVIGGLRHRGGLLSALARGAATALGCWVLAGVLLLWGPAPLGASVADSGLVQVAPPPVHALSQVGHLVSRARA